MAGLSTTTDVGTGTPSTRGYWVPGYEWGPAWVSWRFGGGYVGWAPLPPRAVWTTGIGLRLGGAQIDALIEPRAYTFCPERQFFDPAVNRHALPVTRNAATIAVTRNVTDYGVVNTRVVDRGLGVDRLEAAVGRPAPRPRVLEVDSVSAVRGARGQRDAVTVFRPTVRPRANLTPPQGRAIVRVQPSSGSGAGLAPNEARERDALRRDQQAAEKRREADAREAAKQLARQRELHERTRQEMERRQAAERQILEQQHGRENKKPPAVANLEQRQEQEHRALEERQHQERRQLEASREEARRQREAQASAERRSAEGRAAAQGAPSGKGKEAKGKETPGKGPKAKPEEKDRKG